VTVAGRYLGTLSLRQLTQPVQVSNFHTALNAEKVNGEIRLASGNLSADELTGPVKVTAHATDVRLNGFTGMLDVTVDSGDIELTPQHLPLGGMTVRTRSGDIDLTLPAGANFELSAVTARGEVQNEFGDGLQEHSQGRGTRLEGSVGTGPQLNLTTGSGNITIRKAGLAAPVGARGTEKAVQFVER
jgi:DUF4097 and DUF4098 domain-containing protein YvlB